MAKTAELNSVSIEHMMFRPEDGEALHAAGVAVRFHLQRPEMLRPLRRGWASTSSPRSAEWIADGVVDTISGDDVAFLASLSAPPAATEGGG